MGETSDEGSSSHEPLSIVPPTGEKTVMDAVNSITEFKSKAVSKAKEPQRSVTPVRDAPKVVMRLEEELSDQRSNVVAYRFAIENQGNETVDLVKVDPRLPSGVNLLRVENSTIIEAETRSEKLCSELTGLLRKVLKVKNQAFRALWLQQEKAAVEELFSRGWLRVMWRVGSGEWLKQLERDMESIQYTISNSTDADSAFGKWLKDGSEETKDVAALFSLKILQLRTVENELGGDRTILAIIEPGSFFAVTYIFEFPRSIFESRKYQVAVDITYRQGGATHVSGTTKSLLISPNPVSLSVVAITSSMLGVIVKTILAAEKAAAVPAATTAAIVKTSGISAAVFVDAIMRAWQHGSFVLAAIIGLVFFNVYEFTKVGKNLERMPMSWRASLTIGFLCGLAYEKFFAALQAFLG